MNFSIEKYKDILDDIIGIVPEFQKEICIYPEAPTPNLDHDQIIGLESLGLLQVTTARGKSGLVGIHVAIVAPDMFYKPILMAYVIWYYVKPEDRGKGHGLSLFSFADKQLKQRGAERLFITRKIHMPNENLFKKLDYPQIECGHTKYLRSD